MWLFRGMLYSTKSTNFCKHISQFFSTVFYSSLTKWLRGPDEMTSRAAFGPRAVVWRPWSEPYQPHSITPNLGVTLSQGPKIQSRHHFATQRKLRSTKLKYEALEISEVRGPFERKVLMHYSYFGPFWKQGIYTLQLLLGAPLKAK